MRNYTMQWTLASILKREKIIYLRFKKYLNAGYPRTFICSVLNAFEIKVEKDRIFKKCLNAGYARTFIYSVLNAFDAISAH